MKQLVGSKDELLADSRAGQSDIEKVAQMAVLLDEKLAASKAAHLVVSKAVM